MVVIIENVLLGIIKAEQQWLAQVTAFLGFMHVPR